jgi:DNA primase
MPDLNRRSLEEVFDISAAEPVQPVLYSPDEEDPDTIIRANIDRANRILDRVEEEMLNGNFNSRLVEVASKCIDSVTNAVSQIQSTSFNTDHLQLKQRMIELKENELEYKIKNLGKPTHVGSQNIIFTDRESILKALQNKNTKESE